MGAIGDAKRLMQEAQTKLAAADVDGANACIAQAGTLLSSLSAIADDVTETELVKDLDAAVEEVGKQFPELARAARGLIDHVIRVGTRVSNTAQEVQALVAGIREYGFETRSKIAKPQ